MGIPHFCSIDLLKKLSIFSSDLNICATSPPIQGVCSVWQELDGKRFVKAGPIETMAVVFGIHHPFSFFYSRILIASLPTWNQADDAPAFLQEHIELFKFQQGDAGIVRLDCFLDGFVT